MTEKKPVSKHQSPGTVPEGTVPEGTVEERIQVLERERDEYLETLQRLKADFDNFRKRSEREQGERAASASVRLVKELLPVLDDLERALEAAAEHEEAKLEEGVGLVHRSLLGILSREGLAEIETEGAFDPHVHEALLSQPAEAVYAQATAEQQSSQASGNGAPSDDEVIEDAEVVDEEAKTS